MKLLGKPSWWVNKMLKKKFYIKFFLKAKILAFQMDPRYENGTFNERLKWQQLPPKEKLPLLMDAARRYDVFWIGPSVKWFKVHYPFLLKFFSDFPFDSSSKKRKLLLKLYTVNL